jgi:hypothetical protein
VEAIQLSARTAIDANPSQNAPTHDDRRDADDHSGDEHDAARQAMERGTSRAQAGQELERPEQHEREPGQHVHEHQHGMVCETRVDVAGGRQRGPRRQDAREAEGATGHHDHGDQHQECRARPDEASQPGGGTCGPRLGHRPV